MNEYDMENGFTSVNEESSNFTTNRAFSGKGSLVVVPGQGEKEEMETLRVRHPDSHVGYQPLSEFLVKKYAKRIDAILRSICKDRGITLDFDYWKDISIQLLSAPDPSRAKIIPAKAGYGKSTWMLALMIFFRQLEAEDPDGFCALGGCCVVLQKVATLNEMVSNVEDYAKEMGIHSGSPMVVIQGWTPSGAAHGFCQNPDVHEFRDCHKDRCPFATSCKMLGFAKAAHHAPLIGITQARFNILRNSGNFGDLLTWEPEAGTEIFRRFVIFDEKFEMAEVHDLNCDKLDQATSELEDLLKTRRAKEWEVLFAETRLDYIVKAAFQNLRKAKTKIVVNGDTMKRMIPPKAGFCSVEDVIKASHIDDVAEAFRTFRNEMLEKHQKCLTPAVKECLGVWNSLLLCGEQMLYTAEQGFTLHDITPADLHFGDCLTVIFDATAEVDPDYWNLENADLLHHTLAKPNERVSFLPYTDPSFKVTKTAFHCAWKIPALCREVADIIRNDKGDFFISTYQNYSSAIYAELTTLLEPKDLKRIATVPDRDRHPMLPYYGGTNGDNSFKDCKNVILIGYPRLPPATYLTRACAVFGADAIRAELEQQEADRQCGVEDFREDKEIPLVKEYVRGHVAARLEQEIFRCQIRNFEYDGDTNIYLFYPQADVFQTLLERFPRGSYNTIKTPPSDLNTLKRSSRSFHKESTAFSRFEEYIRTWDGNPIRVSEVKALLEISDAVWKDLRGDPDVKDLLEQYNVVSSGRGRNCQWKKESNDCDAA